MRSAIFVGVLFAACFSCVIALEAAFTLEEFILGNFADTKWNGIWYSDKDIFYPDDKGGFQLFDMTTEKSTSLLSSTDLANYARPSITFSKGKTYALVKYEATAVYRHSTLAKYAVIKMADKSVMELHEGLKDKLLQTCRFSPYEDDVLIAVKDNNIFYHKFPANPADKPTLDQVTTLGEKDVVYNGVPDWIYEEEVIAGDSALWPSSTSPKFIYAEFNDRDVPKFQYPIYGKPGDYANQYPEWKTIRYPKVGQTNPEFTLYVYDPSNKPPKKLSLSEAADFNSKNHVLYNVAWRDNQKVIVTYTNRAQTDAYIVECNVDTQKCTQLATSTTSSTGWLDIQPVHVLNDDASKRFVDIVVKDSYDALRVTAGKDDSTEVTFEQMTVSRIIGDTDKSKIYFEGTKATTHSQQHVYSVDIDSADPYKCLTCDDQFLVMNEPCKYASAVLSVGKTYMTRICSGPGPTYVDIINLKDPTKSYVWLDNKNVRALLSQKAQPIIKDQTYNVGSDGQTASVRLLLPPGFSESQKYPLLVNVYGGPNSNQISDAYSIGLQHYLVTSRNYIYAYIDARGSGKRGRKLMHAVYKNLGGFEIDDQISITKTLRDEFPVIDANKIGIWGWSYGGYATAHVIARDKDTFKCGVSVAPVTDFIYYDSIYTERYMGVYDDKNDEVKTRYEKTDVTKQAEQFRGKNYLLVHGNADDNVHYQQAMQLARALEQADVPFEQMSYPDEAHSLKGVSKHLYHLLDSYWLKQFDVEAEKEDKDNSATAAQLNMVVMVSIFMMARFF